MNNSCDLIPSSPDVTSNDDPELNLTQCEGCETFFSSIELEKTFEECSMCERERCMHCLQSTFKKGSLIYTCKDCITFTKRARIESLTPKQEKYCKDKNKMLEKALDEDCGESVLSLECIENHKHSVFGTLEGNEDSGKFVYKTLFPMKDSKKATDVCKMVRNRTCDLGLTPAVLCINYEKGMNGHIRRLPDDKKKAEEFVELLCDHLYDE